MLGSVSKIWSGIVAAAASTLFLGYCVYFDQLRRADPEYKRKVHERRRREAALAGRPCPSSIRRRQQMPVGAGYEGMQRFFLAEMKSADRLIRTGHTEAGLDHLVNAIVSCRKPEALAQMLQAQLSDRMYNRLLFKMREAEANEAAS